MRKLDIAASNVGCVHKRNVCVVLEPRRPGEATARALAPDEPDPRQAGHRDEQNHSR